ncbi:uracil-DNA glycosylase [Sphingorhabdus sp. Alg239-R122]|uniref:uracil-DNA glycosylase n=1 Tax=Sphingorhabdus sp. Alg239-R122 TaxID=2305989 RepID=UPI0013DBA7AF|nr:uracil-DNA glycosylase [Sphingorhabdus sp. Alg239-R122]
MLQKSPQSQFLPGTEPRPGCRKCPRLADYRREIACEFPDWHGAPVPTWGDPSAWLAIVGLAPGKHGAHRTGRPFTGDQSGEVLFAALDRFALSRGSFANDPEDGVKLDGTMIFNAVKCLPPQNKPIGAELNNCRPYLMRQLAALPNLRVIIALGKVAHDSLVRGFGMRLAERPFGHLAEHQLPNDKILIDSYHCSRYNMNTGRLTTEMFGAVFMRALQLNEVIT